MKSASCITKTINYLRKKFVCDVISFRQHDFVETQFSYRNLNLNSLLVTHQMTVFHQGFGWGRNWSLEMSTCMLAVGPGFTT